MPHQLTEKATSAHLVQLAENEEEDSCEDGSDSSSDISRRKSMPALRWRHRRMFVDADVDDEQVEPPGGAVTNRKESITRAQSMKPELLKKPIITVTQDGLGGNKLVLPSSSEWLYKKRSSSTVSGKSVTSAMNGAPTVTTAGAAAASLKRCMTDSAIAYHAGTDDIEEASGSIFYIQQNGELNYRVILQAVHLIATRPISRFVTGFVIGSFKSVGFISLLI